ncbi:MAG: DAK2 domain-containing protein [Chloroflexota bacterium]
MPDRGDLLSLDGPGVRDMFAAAAAWLERNKEQVNAINVFPVPDGDTGTNMSLTMRSTMEEAQKCIDPSAGAMMAAMSHGALMGARGNSGVILSQILRGAARATKDAKTLDSRGLAAAFTEGSNAAYQAVTKPTEGTILTVIREVGAAATAAANGGSPALLTLLETASETAKESVAKTPTLLPILAQAGVVDAGAQGLSVLIEGMLKHLRGEEIEAAVSSGAHVEHEWLSAVDQRHQVEASPYGYCLEVLLEGQSIDVTSLRDEIMGLGDSAIVVGDETLVRIHVHTDDPGAVLSKGTALGQLAQVKVDNINRQAARFVEMHQAAAQTPAPPATISCVAVAPGDGLADVFRSTGCEQVISGGPTMNPSTGDILAAIDACRSDYVVVLPNDKNIILAAEQAIAMTKKDARVVKSRSVPQGLAAMLASNPDDAFEKNVAEMEAALGSVRTIEITRAARSTNVDGVEVETGQAIAIVDDKLVVATEDADDALIEALGPIAVDGTSLVTLYYGSEMDVDKAEAVASRIRDSIAGHEVEVVRGGQPHYLYIASLE